MPESENPVEAWALRCGPFVHIDGPSRIGAKTVCAGTPGVITGIRMFDPESEAGFLRLQITTQDGQSSWCSAPLPEHVCTPPEPGPCVASFTCPSCGSTWLAIHDDLVGADGWQLISPL